MQAKTKEAFWARREAQIREKVETYIEDVLSGEIVSGKYLIKAVERQVNDLEREDFPYEFNWRKAIKPIVFLEMLPHIKGKKAHTLIELEPWQMFYIATLYGWLDEEGYRRFKTGYLEIARKNAKSTIAAGLLLYHALLDGEKGAECYTASTQADQAKVCWEIAARMVNNSEFLSQSFKRWQHHIETLESNPATIKYLSKDKSGNKEGLNPSFVVVDELHALAVGDTTRESLKTGMGSRSQGLMLEITTAGENQEGYCYQQRGTIIGILEGTATDEETFGVIYTIDPEDEWDIEENWYKANPNIGASVYIKNLQGALVESKNNPIKRNAFLQKHLNVWTSTSASFIDSVHWATAGDRSINLSSFKGKRVYIGLDLSKSVDLTAVAIIAPEYNEKNEIISAKTLVQHFLPVDMIQRSSANGKYYAQWKEMSDQKHEEFRDLTFCAGGSINYEQVLNYLKKLVGMLDVAAIGFDPWHATHLVQTCEDLGWEMVEVGQQPRILSDPLKLFQKLLTDETFKHPDSVVLNWQARNLLVEEMDNAVLKMKRNPNKSHKDGFSAIMTGLSLALTETHYNETMLGKDSAFIELFN